MAWNDFTGSGPGGSWIVGDRFGNNQVEIIRQNFVTLKGVRLFGPGSPEGTVTAVVGELYRRTDGGPGTTLYIKESGAGNTGWRAVSVPPAAPVVASVVATLTDAQIKTLPTTRVAVVAAPIAGFRVKLISASLLINNVAGVYTNVSNSGEMFLSVGGKRVSNRIFNDLGTPPIDVYSDFLGTAHNTFIDLTVKLDNDVPGLGTPTDFVAKSLDLTVTNTGDYTGGNVANSLKVTTYYGLEAV